jgi:hypothetical protein
LLQIRQQTIIIAALPLTLASRFIAIMKRLRQYSFVFLVLFLSYCCLVQVVKATDVKWEQGDHDANNAAHTAPKSQRYYTVLRDPIMPRQMLKLHKNVVKVAEG